MSINQKPADEPKLHYTGRLMLTLIQTLTLTLTISLSLTLPVPDQAEIL